MLIKALSEIREISEGNFVVGVTAWSYVVLDSKGNIYLFPREEGELDHQFVINLFGLFNDPSFAESNSIDLNTLKVYPAEDWDILIRAEQGFLPILVVPLADIPDVVNDRVVH